MSRGTRVLVDLSALNENLDIVRRHAPGCTVLAVVKANAYGHGIERVVKALDDVEGFAVATLEEAVRVRSESPEQRVVLLEGIISAQDLALVEKLNLDLVVHSYFQIEMLEKLRQVQSPLRIWLKVDTGMNRLGFQLEEAAAVFKRLQALTVVKSDEIVLTSHLANADDPSDPKTAIQTEAFSKIAQALGCDHLSLANSAGVMGWPQSCVGWVRTGLALYGSSPLINKTAGPLGLRPSMSLYARLIAINHCHRGAAIGYGSAWSCPEDMPVGIVGIGYGDGYPRHAANGTPVMVGDQICPLIGRVSMDMISVDLRLATEAKVGDEVELWGASLPIERVAKSAETIAYELLCGVTSRVPVEYCHQQV